MTVNRKTLYRESQKIPTPHPRLASPIKLPYREPRAKFGTRERPHVQVDDASNLIAPTCVFHFTKLPCQYFERWRHRPDLTLPRPWDPIFL
jgi:hypothetical protein